MTKAARNFISKKIRILRREGYSQSQAVRIAFEMARKEGFKVPKMNPAEIVSIHARREWCSFSVDKQVRILQFISGYVKQYGLDREKLIAALIHMFDVDEDTADYIIDVYNKTICRKSLPIKRENPAVPNNAVEIYDHILAIEAVKGDKSLWPKEQFRHEFKVNSKASIYGLPDGSLLIKSKNGKKLWKKFEYGPEDM